MDCKAQVSFEYLLAAMFGIILAMAAAVLVEAVRAIAVSAQAKVLDVREQTIASLL